MLYKVKGHDALIKDSRSQAVLNTDLAAVRRHNERLMVVNRELSRDSTIAELRSEMNEIKALLRELLGKTGL